MHYFYHCLKMHFYLDQFLIFLKLVFFVHLNFFSLCRAINLWFYLYGLLTFVFPVYVSMKHFKYNFSKICI